MSTEWTDKDMKWVFDNLARYGAGVGKDGYLHIYAWRDFVNDFRKLQDEAIFYRLEYENCRRKEQHSMHAAQSGTYPKRAQS